MRVACRVNTTNIVKLKHPRQGLVMSRLLYIVFLRDWSRGVTTRRELRNSTFAGLSQVEEIRAVRYCLQRHQL